MPNFWKVTNEVIRRSDVVLEVLDARFPSESRNLELEQKIVRQEKQLIYVINKCDLVSKDAMDKWKKKLKPSVFVSSKKMLGVTMLRHLILRYSDKNPTFIGVVGYPNVGKSSIINALKGRKSAQVSPVSGHTKGLQKIKIGPKLKIIDSPGVIPFMEKDEVKHALFGTISTQYVKDPELVAYKLIEVLPHVLVDYYEISFEKEFEDDPELFLEAIAKKLNMLRTGGKPDIIRAGRKVIDDWQKGKMPLENYDHEGLAEKAENVEVDDKRMKPQREKGHVLADEKDIWGHKKPKHKDYVSPYSDEDGESDEEQGFEEE